MAAADPSSQHAQQLELRPVERALGPTVADLAAWWQSTRIHRPGTAVLVSAQLRNHVIPAFGDRALASIRPSHVQAWVRQLSERLAPSTVHGLYRRLAGICDLAVADGLIEATPCRGIVLPRIEQPPIRPPTRHDVEAVIAATPEPYRTIVVLAAGTGLRQGECLGLTPDRIDLEGRTVTVDRQLVVVDGSQPRLAPPKTRASYRQVPLPAVVTEALSAHLERHRPGPEGLVFTTRQGRPIRRHRMGEVWRAAVKKAGVHGRMRFHDLRHFYASVLIAHGESVKVVQARLGHATATLTLDTYAHLWPDDGERTRSAVDAVLSST